MTDNIRLEISVLDTPKRNDSGTERIETEGSALIFENVISNAICRIPTNSTKLLPKKVEFEKVIDGTTETFEFSVKCLRRGNCQLSLFGGDDEIKLSDTSKKVFVALLKATYDYYKLNEKDVENLVIKLSPKTVAPFLSTTFSDDANTRKNQTKEVRKAIKTFEKELSEIRVITDYTYYKNGKKESVQFDGGIFSKDTYVRKLDENGKVVLEGFPINPQFYYSLINCNHIMQMPFTAFAITGKNAFSIIFDLYAHSRENRGKQEFKTLTLLEHLGFDDRINKQSFKSATRERVVDILRNAQGSAIKSFNFVSDKGENLDLETCSNSEWVNSTLVWEQLIPSETPILTDRKEALEMKKEKSSTRKRRTSKG